MARYTGPSCRQCRREGEKLFLKLFRKLETCGKPWVSAINGTCMGGAFELSLSCHARVAADRVTDWITENLSR